MRSLPVAWLEILCPPLLLVRWWSSFALFQKRAIARQYKTNSLGVLWAALVPLATLWIYAFVFGSVMHSRWEGAVTASGEEVAFSLYLFAGLIVFWPLAQSAADSCGAVIGHANLVKKAVFPLEILPLTIVGAALFHAAINTVVLLAAMLYVHGGIPPTVLLWPIVLAPYVLMLAGFSWFLAALGAFFRDLNYLIGLMLTGLSFLSPIFYSLSRLSPDLRTLVMLNPVSLIVTQARAVLVEGHAPDWSGLLVYFMVAWSVAAGGLLFFRRSKRFFADVL